MGIKGDKLTQDSVTAAEEFVNKLDSIGGITSKRMFCFSYELRIMSYG